MTEVTYMDDTDWQRLVSHLTNIALNADSEIDVENAIKIALGEIGNVWPNSIYASAEYTGPTNGINSGG